MRSSKVKNAGSKRPPRQNIIYKILKYGKNKKKGTLAKELRCDPSSSTKTKKEIQLANELRDPIAIQPTYSMRSVKTSEGMKLNDFVSSFNTLSPEQYKNEQVVCFTECIVVHEADATRIAHWLS